MAIKGGISWFFNNYSEVHLDIYSDEKTRRSEGAIPDGVNSDNFEEYLKWQIGTQNNKGPVVNMPEDIKCVKCPKKGPYASENEFPHNNFLFLLLLINPCISQRCICY
jgi:hypothetical protein